MIHMTEVHPGNVGVTEGPYCREAWRDTTPGMGWLDGWQAAFSSQPRKDPGGGCLGERQMALWSRHFVDDTAWGGGG